MYVDKKIRCNVICPGGVETEVMNGQQVSQMGLGRVLAVISHTRTSSCNNYRFSFKFHFYQPPIFARALLADPKILILDEATSSIDTETEIVLQKGLAELLVASLFP